MKERTNERVVQINLKKQSKTNRDEVQDLQR